MDIKTKEEYMILLSKELKYLKKDERNKILNYYYNKITTDIDYGRSEKDTLNSLPDPADIAKEQYNKHGIRYLDIRKTQMKRRDIFSKILNSLLLLFILSAEIFIAYLLIRSDIKIISLASSLIKISFAKNLITIIAIIFFILTLIVVLIYAIDLFIIIDNSFIIKIFNFNEEQINKISNFSINVLLEEKFKINKLLLKIFGALAIISLILFIVSFTTKGYLYRSLNNYALNEERIDIESFNNIDLKCGNINIELNHNSDGNYIIYKYEFKHELNNQILDNTLKLEYGMSNTYDILNILTEPTQSLIINLKNDFDLNKLNIKMVDGKITLIDSFLNDLELEIDSKTEIVLSKVNINNIQIKANNLYFGITESNIKNLKVEATTGQEIIEKNTTIEELNITSSSVVKYSESSINNLKMINKGNVTFDKMNIDNLDMESSISQTTINDTIINKGTLAFFNNSYLTTSGLLAREELKITSSSSHLLLNHVKSKLIDCLGSSTYLFLTDINQNKEGFEEYNIYNEESQLITNIDGTLSKTEISDSKIDNVLITQTRGYLITSNSYFKSSIVNLNRTTGTSFTNLDGEKMDMYVDNIEEYLRFKADSKKNIKIYIKKIDALSNVYLEYNNSEYDVILDLTSE